MSEMLSITMTRRPCTIPTVSLRTAAPQHVADTLAQRPSHGEASGLCLRVHSRDDAGLERLERVADHGRMVRDGAGCDATFLEIRHGGASGLIFAAARVVEEDGSDAHAFGVFARAHAAMGACNDHMASVLPRDVRYGVHDHNAPARMLLEHAPPHLETLITTGDGHPQTLRSRPDRPALVVSAGAI